MGSKAKTPKSPTTPRKPANKGTKGNAGVAKSAKSPSSGAGSGPTAGVSKDAIFMYRYHLHGGSNWSTLAKQCGVSVSTVQRWYARIKQAYELETVTQNDSSDVAMIVEDVKPDKKNKQKAKTAQIVIDDDESDEDFKLTGYAVKAEEGVKLEDIKPKKEAIENGAKLEYIKVEEKLVKKDIKDIKSEEDDNKEVINSKEDVVQNDIDQKDVVKKDAVQDDVVQEDIDYEEA